PHHRRVQSDDWRVYRRALRHARPLTTDAQLDAQSFELLELALPVGLADGEDELLIRRDAVALDLVLLDETHDPLRARRRRRRELERGAARAAAHAHDVELFEVELQGHEPEQVEYRLGRGAKAIADLSLDLRDLLLVLDPR